MKSDATAGAKVITELARKVKCEMKSFSSAKSDSIFRDMYAALQQFSWKSVFLELSAGLPTLINFLVQIIPRPKDSIPLVCMIASQLLKGRHQRMSLVQRAVSTMLYGNGTKKQVRLLHMPCMDMKSMLIIMQVYSSLQKLNVCMSYGATLHTIDKVCEDYDIDVQFWVDNLRENSLLV